MCVIANVAVLLPVAILTELGTDAIDGSELLSLIVTPGESVGPVNVTVPVTVVFDPPTKVLGVAETDPSTAGLIVSTTDWKFDPETAFKVAVCADTMAFVFTANVAELDPLGITTLAGIVTEGLIEVSVTVMPAGGAEPFRLT